MNRTSCTEISEGVRRLQSVKYSPTVKGSDGCCGNWIILFLPFTQVLWETRKRFAKCCWCSSFLRAWTLTWGLTEPDLKKYSLSVASRKSRAAVLSVQQMLQKYWGEKNEELTRCFHLSQDLNQVLQVHLFESCFSIPNLVPHLHGTSQRSLNFGEASIGLLSLRSPGDGEKEAYSQKMPFLVRFHSKKVLYFPLILCLFPWFTIHFATSAVS